MIKIKPAMAFMLPLLVATSALADSPPATWQEHWFEHNQVMTKVFQDNDVAVYYDPDVSRSVTWPNTYMSQVWRYTKKTYGNFGVQPQLYALFHTNKYSGGHPSGYFDGSHDFRNVIDVGPGPWTSGTGNDLDLTTHESPISWRGTRRGSTTRLPSGCGATASGPRSSSSTYTWGSAVPATQTAGTT